jgi:hypothetical protein
MRLNCCPCFRFVLDLVAPQLHGLDLTDVWNLHDPMGYLAKVKYYIRVTVLVLNMLV